MLIPNLTILVFFIAMNTSDMTVVKNLTVGESITLPSPKIQDGALYFNNSAIAAVVVEGESTITKDFREQLQWNKDSGQFRITGLQRKNSGIYKLEDTNKKKSTLYHLNVYDPAPKPCVKVSAVSSESCSLVCFVEKDDETVLYWFKGETILNQTSTVPSLPLIVDKEALDSSYSCVAANPANNNTLALNITALCSDYNLIIITNDDSRTGYWWLCFVVLAVIIALFVMMIIIKRKRDRTPQGIISMTSCDSTKEPVYTEVNVKRTNRQKRNSPELSEISPPVSNLTTVYDTVSLRHMNKTDAV